jgi:hypothetical protein
LLVKRLLLTLRSKPMAWIYEELKSGPEKLYCSPMLYVLAIFFANNAFRDYRSVEELFALQITDEDQLWHEVAWDERVLDLPIFPNISPAIFHRLFVNVGYRAGFTIPLTNHQIRAEVLILIDGKRHYPCLVEVDV